MMQNFPGDFESEAIMPRQRYKLPDVLSRYQGRISGTQSSESSHLVRLALEDPETLGARISDTAVSLVDRCEETKVSERDFREKKILNFPLQASVVDASAPLTFVLQKKFIKKETLPPVTSIYFELHRTALESGDAGVITQHLRFNVRPQQDTVSALRFDQFSEKEEFNLGDRYTYPQYRNQRFGTHLLHAAESFFQKKANDRKKGVSLTAEVAQLDVLLWFYHQGYSFQTEEDKKRFFEITTGSENLCIGENYYVFPKDIPEAERTAGNMHDAYRVRFIKKFLPRE